MRSTASSETNQSAHTDAERHVTVSRHTPVNALWTRDVTRVFRVIFSLAQRVDSTETVPFVSAASLVVDSVTKPVKPLAKPVLLRTSPSSTAMLDHGATRLLPPASGALITDGSTKERPRDARAMGCGISAPIIHPCCRLRLWTQEPPGPASAAGKMTTSRQAQPGARGCEPPRHARGARRKK